MFTAEIRFSEATPEARIKQLRGSGLSLASVAQQTRTSVAVVRRIVGKVDVERTRRRYEEAAKRIDSEGGTWTEKVAKWKAETGRCAVTYWRVLKDKETVGQMND
jgi:hypothetical protein